MAHLQPRLLETLQSKRSRREPVAGEGGAAAVVEVSQCSRHPLDERTSGIYPQSNVKRVVGVSAGSAS